MNSFGINFLVISTLTLAELKSRYRNTWAGLLWVILNPLIMFGVHSLIFKIILKIEIEQYFVFLLGGLIPWIFISSTLMMTVNSFITHREVLLSFQISPLSILAAKVIDNFINFILPFLILFLILSFSQSFNMTGVMLLPLAMIPLFISTFYLSLLIATLQVHFRDTQYILNFVTSIFYFLTPIFYPAEMVPESLKFLLYVNPFYKLISPFQVALWSFEFEMFFMALSESIICSAIIFVISFLYLV
jgi:ABC-type polysaccharide/polyol phosphate export permease